MLGDQAAASPAEELARPTGSERVLVVEDDPDVRALIVTTLTAHGYTVRAARDARDALTTLDAEGDIDLLLTDVVLPGGINGSELAIAARHSRPDLRVLYISGYTRSALTHQGRLDEGVVLLSKPFTRAQLARTIRVVLDAESPAP